MLRKIAGLLLALTILAGVMSVSANDEKKLKVIDMNCDSLMKISGEIYKLKQEYSADNGYVIKLAAYDTEGKLVATSSDDDYRQYLPKQMGKTLAYVWRTYSTNGNNITAFSLQVGTDESEKRLVWYNDQDKGAGRVQFALKSDFDKDGGFTDENSKIITAETQIPHGNKSSISNKAVLKNLKLGQTYVYRLGGKESFSEKVYSFRTYDASNNDKQTFLVVSDLHNNSYTIDSVAESTHVKNYQKYFNNYILPRHPDTEFIISTGDNVSQGNMPTQFKEYMNSDEEIYRQKAELEMEVLFAPDVFQTVPFASAPWQSRSIKFR